MKNKIFTIVLFLISNLAAVGQSWQWAKSAGGTDTDQGHAIATDASGNVLVTGYFAGASITFGTTTLTNAGGSDIFIVKYDASGNVLWAKSAGGTSTDNSKSISTDANGNVAITGNFASPSITFGTTTLTNTASPGADVFVVKYDASGNVLWAKKGGGTNSEYGTGIACDASGNVIATGYFPNAGITFETISLTSAGQQDIFVVKYDALGNVLWAKAQGGTSFDNGNSIATDASGNILVTGYFQSGTISFGTTTLNNTTSGNNDIFMVKYDVAGNVLWAKAAGGTLVDNATGITTDVNENVLLTGYFQSPTITFGTITLNNISAQDIFVVKYDAAGTVLWAKKQGGAGSDYGYALSTDANANVAVTGYFDSPSINFGTTVLTNVGAKDVFVAKYDASGNILSAVAAGGTDNDEGLGIAYDASGNVITTGRFSSSAIAFGSTTLTNAGIYDIFVSKLSLCINSATLNEAACNSYTSPSGNYTWTLSGVYYDTLTNVAGCDSLLTINLIINTVNTTVTQSNNVLTANASGANYQWLDCDNGNVIISGETSQSFTPNADGNYAVAITQNGCTDTSICYVILGTGVNQLSTVNYPLSITPNPATDYITIATRINTKQVITISDITGKIIYNTTTLSDKTIINTKDFPQGVYAVSVQADGFIETRKVIVMK